MGVETIGLITTIAFFVLMFLGIPIAFGLGIVGLVGYWVITDFSKSAMSAALMSFSHVGTYSFTVIPLFLIMAEFASRGGIFGDLFTAAKLWVSKIPGGLVQATIVAATGFAACSGSGLASCATLAKICLPEMKKQGVNVRMAIGAVAACGPIAQMIPPSILMVIYGTITEQSIGKLLIAGIFPGLLTAVVFMTLVFIRVKRDPSLAPAYEQKATWGTRFVSIGRAWAFAIIALVIFGGIYGGVFTPTEAGGVAAFVTFLIFVFRGKAGWTQVKGALLTTVRTTSMIFLIIASAFIFAYFLSIAHVPRSMSEFLVGLPVSRWILYAGIMVMYLILGCFMDMIAAMFITLPIIFPTILALGFDPIWFGVIMVHQCEMALITPPFGLNLFLLKDVADVNIGETIKGVMPFILADLVTLTLLSVFPQISLFLPSMMR